MTEKRLLTPSIDSWAKSISTNMKGHIYIYGTCGVVASRAAELHWPKKMAAIFLKEHLQEWQKQSRHLSLLLRPNCQDGSRPTSSSFKTIVLFFRNILAWNSLYCAYQHYEIPISTKNILFQRCSRRWKEIIGRECSMQSFMQMRPLPERYSRPCGKRRGEALQKHITESNLRQHYLHQILYCYIFLWALFGKHILWCTIKCSQDRDGYDRLIDFFINVILLNRIL